MKKLIFVLFFLALGVSVFAQRIYTVAVMPFETFVDNPANASARTGASSGDAAEATRLVIAALGVSETLTLLTGLDEANADYVIRGRIDVQNNQFILAAATSEAGSGRVLNNSRAQIASLNSSAIFSFCSQVVSYIPYPSWHLGRWQSTINMADGPVTCIMELKSDRTVNVERFDTWEHNGTTILKYHGIGKGSCTYTFTGYHLFRTVTVNGRQVRTNALLEVKLALEDALPKYESITASSLAFVFDESRTGFQLVNAGIPCGDNLTGPSVYPDARVFYTSFSKIR